MESRFSKSCEGDFMKKSSLAILRSQQKAYKNRIKKQSQMMKIKKHLKEQIYNNNNIFQIPDIKFNRRSAQNMIWQKNYKLKISINMLHEENNSLKAKLWNIQKQNRKMDKQIQSWNLDKIYFCQNNKPYIDMATISKVFQDQDYEIVSIKIDINQLQNIIKNKQFQIDTLTHKVEQTQKFMGFLKHYTTQQKIKLLTTLYLNNTSSQFQQQITKIKNNQSRQVLACNQRIDFLKKNIQLKKKINLAHQHQRQTLLKQLSSYSNITQQQISQMKHQLLQTKLQQQNQIKHIKKTLKSIKQNKQGFQYQIQGSMTTYIQTKILLNQSIQLLMSNIQNQFSHLQSYHSYILPSIRKLN